MTGKWRDACRSVECNVITVCCWGARRCFILESGMGEFVMLGLER